LVVTLSLMILLTIIAVRLSTLSSVSLRASNQGMAMAEARANARLALMLAIGDLQKSLGPDRAVTASSEILTATPAKPHTNGVWESWWDFNPSGSSLDYKGEKQKRFRRWLVSNADPAALDDTPDTRQGFPWKRGCRRRLYAVRTSDLENFPTTRPQFAIWWFGQGRCTPQSRHFHSTQTNTTPAIHPRLLTSTIPNHKPSE
jgi:hypothetical protein